MSKVFWIGMCACGVMAAADAAYVGKWKINPAKSDFGETTVTYEVAANGEIKMSMDGQSFTLKADGKDTPNPWGGTTALKSVNAKTWESIDKVGGKVVSTSTTKLSDDGKALTIDSKRTDAAGKISNNSATFERVSGTSGLAGKWKTKKVSMGSPSVLELTAKGADGLTVTQVEEKGVCDAKLDGKDYPATGPIWPSGWTCSLARNGTNGFDATWKKDGKAMYKSTFTAAGKTLTEVGSAAGVNEKFKIVYDKQ